MALNDVIADNTDLNLKLFIMSLNPLFVLNAKKKIELTSLINKYVIDKNKLRLLAIELYLGAVKQTKVKKTKQLDIPVINIINKNSPEQEALIDKLNELRTEFMMNLKANNEGTIQRQMIIRTEMQSIETKLGLYAGLSDFEQYNQGMSEESDLDNKKMMFRNMFGDFNNPNTMAWSLTHAGGMREFVLSKEQALFDPSLIYKDIFMITGIRPVLYNILHHPVDLSWIFSLGYIDGNKILTDKLVGVR